MVVNDRLEDATDQLAAIVQRALGGEHAAHGPLTLANPEETDCNP